MRGSPLLAVVCVLAIVLSGCTGLISGDDPRTDEPGSGLPDGCISPFDGGDHREPLCKFTEQPPDIWVRNDGQTQHLQLYVVTDNSTVLLSESMTVDANTPVVIEDVFDQPGPYTILASADNTTSAARWEPGQRYSGDGGIVWDIAITPSGQIKNSYFGG